ncbi:component of IIS longevity pathway SMK-1-domain-containing protein [Lipomyces oligophaga]|uniref:component of IIS longevity pathway SMK-1-domain-containing protein n=1 Tax=Lipomyces oligophaga TaxID=45792 RepID=UPI0034CD050B
MTSVTSLTPRRVKVYELQHESWYDRGTGFCVGDYVQDEAFILVKSEDAAEKYLLETRIYREVQYQKQQDTLIVWTEPDDTDLALSFQEREGCASVWDFITEVQRQLASDELPSDDAVENCLISIPTDPALKNLREIERSISLASQTPYGRDAVVREVLDHNYIAKLIHILEEAEDLESLEDLHSLCQIIKLIVLMNDNTIMEQIVLDEYYLGVFGILEYDPEFATNKANHREYISDQSRFKEVVPIPDPEIRNKIQYTFRLQYLKDVILARVLDDLTFSTLSSMIYFHQVEILNYLQHNDSFTTELFNIFNDDIEFSSRESDFSRLSHSELSKRRDAVRFLYQICLTAKHFPNNQRTILYSCFMKKGLLNVINFAFRDDLSNIRSAGTELILAILDHDPSLLRASSSKSHSQHVAILDTMIDLLLSESDFGVISQISDAIQILLDPFSGQVIDMFRKQSDMLPHQRSEDPEVEIFLDSFYSQFADKLFAKFKSISSTLKHIATAEVSLYVCLCDLICSFIRYHGYRSRTFLVESSILQNIVILFEGSHKSLKLAALRCFRQCLSTNDEFYYRFLMSNKLFGPIIKMTSVIALKNNLLSSACLEFFEFIRTASDRPEFRTNMRLIVNHLITLYKEEFCKLKSLPTVQSLLDFQFSALPESPITGNLSIPQTYSDSEKWNSIREYEIDEGIYFSAPEENATSDPMSKSAALGPINDEEGNVAEERLNNVLPPFSIRDDKHESSFNKATSAPLSQENSDDIRHISPETLSSHGSLVDDQISSNYSALKTDSSCTDVADENCNNSAEDLSNHSEDDFLQKRRREVDEDPDDESSSILSKKKKSIIASKRKPASSPTNEIAKKSIFAKATSKINFKFSKS